MKLDFFKKKLTLFFTSLLFLFLYILIPLFRPINSTPVTNLRDQLSTAQLSYFGRLGTGNTAGNSIIYINTTAGTAPSNNNYNLFVGDTLAIADVGNSDSDLYIVSDVAGTNSIFLSSAIDSSNVTTGAYVIATRSAIHTVSFSPQSSVTGGKWQVLLKASNISGENPADGMPDQGGFDIGTSFAASDVTCPWGATASVGTTVVLTSGISAGSTGSYHLVTCSLGSTGTNPVSGETGTIVIGDTHKLINPAPAPSHTVGQANASADTYAFLVRHLDSSDNIINNDTTIGKIALTESVLVTAIIDPTITFYIDNIGVSAPGGTRCGTTLSNGAANTTATTVNFGSLSLGQFNTLAQRFTCSTNALSGYTVQVYEVSPLTVTSVGSSSFIPDTVCDSACTVDSPEEWDTNVSSSQFGYSLESILSSPVTFEHNDIFNSKPFGIGYSNARTIMSRTSTPSTEDRGYICYRITASNFQEAGTYQNQINFIATATF